MRISDLYKQYAFGGSSSAAPVLGTKNISENGSYSASADNLDGYSSVNVNVAPPLQEKTATANGNITPDSGYYGLSQVTVNVTPALGTKTVTANGTYAASADNLDGFSSVTVAIPSYDSEAF